MMLPHDFVRLVDTRGPALILYARQWCHAPEDVVQDAFLKLVALRPPPRDAVAWLYRVVRNAAIDAGKADRRRQRREAATARLRTLVRRTRGRGAGLRGRRLRVAAAAG